MIRKFKVIGILVMVLSGSVMLHAQQTDETKTKSKVGVKGGVNFSNFYTEDVDDENVLIGFNVGVFTEMKLNNMISLQPELLFTTRGSTLNYNNTFATGEAKFALSYLELPLLFRVNFGNTFNIHAGPYAALLVNSKITNEGAGGTFNFEETINRDDLNTFDYGLAAGFGFDLGGLGIGARYNYGLQTVGKERTFLGQPYTFPNGKNSNLSIYAAFYF